MSIKQNSPGLGERGAGTGAAAVAAGRLSYMFSIMTSPKPEQDTCVAPSIRRAKS
jgi:hypothetical protein